jgi:DNA polymerase III epsilon subunit-like protein
MKYVSIDIETSGLNPDMNNILSIGAIIEDTERNYHTRNYQSSMQ